MPKKRSVFEDLRSAIEDLRLEREGKITLRRTRIETPKPLDISPEQIIEIREKILKLSRAVFARLFRVKERTLERWEQGRGKPNEQAITLILMAAQYPDTPERLRMLSERASSLTAGPR